MIIKVKVMREAKAAIKLLEEFPKDSSNHPLGPFVMFLLSSLTIGLAEKYKASYSSI